MRLLRLEQVRVAVDGTESRNIRFEGDLDLTEIYRYIRRGRTKWGKLRG